MARWAELEISGWGRYPRATAMVARPETRRDVIRALADREGAPVLAQGLRRSYGDAALLSGARDGGRILNMTRLDRMLSFDPDSGWLRCEAGVTIADISSTFLPRGFFPPVVPGTKHVTVAGALASDIHGKNHHLAGSWANHVRAVEVLLASGDIVTCDADSNADLFQATAGGQGLTGIILAMDVRLARVEAGAEIEVESVGLRNLDEFVRVSRESAEHPYTVGWIDGTARGRSLGRGVFFRGRVGGAAGESGALAASGTTAGSGASQAAGAPGAFGTPDASGAPTTSGVTAPPPTRGALIDGRRFSFNWLLNPLSVRAYNSVYYLRRRGTKRGRATFDQFFFPLDAVRNWNYLYGRRGFLQYQFVVPHDPAIVAVRSVLGAIASSRQPSFLGVIKEFGPQANGGLSFPIPGITVALDFPNSGTKLLALLDRLDDIVAGAGGRVYLSKDARLGRDAFRRMYPDWLAWKQVRDQYDPEGVMQSELGRRLGLVGE